jgi:membrane-associated protease RseP (regulator of RpoE activity)
VRSWLGEPWVNLVLLVLTAVSIFLTGASQVTPGAGGQLQAIFVTTDGLKLTAAVLAVMVAHEMGHYLMCRYYRVDATLPYLIPFPFLSFVGTLGAFIRIKRPFPHRKALFDIGIAGPLAGFAVCLPVLALGILEARWGAVTHGGEGPGYFGEPLLFQWAVMLLRGVPADGMTLYIGPLGMAAWFGLFLTALNMMPVGQLDGGHVAHALWPRQAIWISRAALGVCLVLLYRRPTWLLWTFLLLVFGRRPHPPTLWEESPVGWPRLCVGLLGFAIFAVCFTPNPIMVSWPQFFELLGLTSR